VTTHIFNRHKDRLTGVNKDIRFNELAKTKNWYVYTGEYLNKNKRGEGGDPLNHVFIIWDVLVWDGEYLVGKYLYERLDLLERIYPCYPSVISNRLESYKHLCNTYIPLIYKAPTYLNRFSELYNDLVTTDLYEGLVLKKLNSKLTYGMQPMNNHEWQIKCRKETKIYTF
jgi:ATP-dependent DNA ligase